MDSLKSIFGAMVQVDMEKQASYEEEYYEADYDDAIIKQAQDYDNVGRILAHNVFTDLVKEAMDESMPGASEGEKAKEVAKVISKAKGEKSEDDEDDEDEDEDDKEKSEKTAAYRQAVLQRMYEDPAYVQELVAKYY